MGNAPLPIIEWLDELRGFGGEVRTAGLPDDVIQRFARFDSRLPEAVQAAVEEFRDLCDEEPRSVYTIDWERRQDPTSLMEKMGFFVYLVSNQCYMIDMNLTFFIRNMTVVDNDNDIDHL